MAEHEEAGILKQAYLLFMFFRGQAFLRALTQQPLSLHSRLLDAIDAFSLTLRYFTSGFL